MVMMKVDLTHPNTALRSIYKNPKQIITLDANCLIPPDRSSLTRRTFRFQRYQEFWLDPIFSAFPNLAIHEAVYEELVSISLQRYVEEKINSNPPEIIIHQDSSL